MLKGTVIVGLVFFPFLICGCDYLDGRYPSGHVYALDIAGDYIYFGSGTEFVVADISQGASPLKTGGILVEEYILDVAVSDDTAYLALGSHGLRVVDVSDPYHPVELAEHARDLMDVRCVDAEGSRIYLLDAVRGLIILDDSPSGKPEEIGNYGLGTHFDPDDLKVDYPYVFISPGILILDVSTPESPVHVSSIAGKRDFFVRESTLYCCTNDYVHFIDISDIYQPVEIGRVLAWDIPMGVCELEGILFVITYRDLGIHRMSIYDISDPQQPETLVYSYKIQLGSDIAMKDGNIYLAEGYEGIRVIDVTDPTDPTLTGRIDTPTLVSLQLFGSYLFGGDYFNGVWVFTLADNGKPMPTNFVDVPGRVWELKLSGDRLFVAAGKAGMRMFDIRYPHLLFEMGRYGAVEAIDVDVSGNIAVLADLLYDPVWGSDGHLDILDITYPWMILPRAQIEWPYSEKGVFTSVRIVDRMLYACGGPYVFIYDISDPRAPVPVTTLNIPCLEFIVEDSVMYVESLTDLFIMDVSDPFSPEIMGSVPIRGADSSHFSYNQSKRYLEKQDDLIFLVESDPVLSMIDVEDPFNPAVKRKISLLNEWDRLSNIDIAGERMGVVTKNFGIGIYNIRFCIDSRHNRPLVKPD